MHDCGDPNGTRTHVSGVRGQRPRPLDDGATPCRLAECGWGYNTGVVLNYNLCGLEGLLCTVVMLFEAALKP